MRLRILLHVQTEKWLKPYSLCMASKNNHLKNKNSKTLHLNPKYHFIYDLQPLIFTDLAKAFTFQTYVTVRILRLQ